MIMVWKQQLFPIQRKKKDNAHSSRNIYEPCVGGDLDEQIIKTTTGLHWEK